MNRIIQRLAVVVGTFYPHTAMMDSNDLVVVVRTWQRERLRIRLPPTAVRGDSGWSTRSPPPATFWAGCLLGWLERNDRRPAHEPLTPANMGGENTVVHTAGKGCE